MRAVIQRVTHASVTVEGEKIGAIKQGLLIFLGIEDDDHSDDITWLSGKILKMRIFEDFEGKMNRSLLENKGDALVISQFTLHASTKKGNRPSFTKAAAPEKAKQLYEGFLAKIRADIGKPIASGIFGADMKIELLNDGPVTIVIDSKLRW